jgi:hypothetical protein
LAISVTAASCAEATSVTGMPVRSSASLSFVYLL